MRASEHDIDAESDRPQPDFGPRGYLPERAAKRARKIILREQMGLQWPLAAGVAAVVVLLAGAVFLATGTGPPDPPFQPVRLVEAVDPRGAEVLPAGRVHDGLTAPTSPVAVMRAGGAVRAFLAPADAVWCPASRRLEGSDGQVWNATGRLVGGRGESLRSIPTQVHDGVVYVDETAPAPPAPAEDLGEAPACADRAEVQDQRDSAS